jgi:hypothetical protein
VREIFNYKYGEAPNNICPDNVQDWSKFPKSSLLLQIKAGEEDLSDQEVDEGHSNLKKPKAPFTGLK